MLSSEECKNLALQEIMLHVDSALQSCERLVKCAQRNRDLISNSILLDLEHNKVKLTKLSEGLKNNATV